MNPTTSNQTIPGQLVVGPYLNELRTSVNRLLGLNHDKFPGPQPVSFTKDNIDDLLNRNFFVCEKSDGLRLLLFATYNRPERKYETFLINRAFQFYFSKLLLPIPPEDGITPYTQFHHNTLIDGELIVDVEPNGQHTLKFLIFDCLICRDKVLTSRPFHIRLGHFHDFILKPLKLMSIERPDLTSRIPFTIEPKEMQLSYHVKQTFNEMKLLKHKSDGLIFTSSEEPVKLGTDRNILKWKPADENSVDFKLVIRGGRFELHLWHGGRLHQYHCDLLVDDIHLKSALAKANGRIIECHYIPTDEQHPWRFMRFRSDKDTANHVSVFQKIMESIMDGIDQSTLENLCHSIRANWKNRELDGPSRAPTLSPPQSTNSSKRARQSTADVESNDGTQFDSKSEYVPEWDLPNAGDPPPRSDDWFHLPDPAVGPQGTTDDSDRKKSDTSHALPARPDQDYESPYADMYPAARSGDSHQSEPDLLSGLEVELDL